MNLHPEVLAVLNKVKRFDPQASIAGGYLRDLFAGRQPKDIDIFVRTSEIDKDIHSFHDSGAVIDTSISITLSYLEQPDVNSVYNYSIVRGKPVQIIVLNTETVEEKFREHDFGICQVWHDGTYIHTTLDFDNDITNKTFTLCYCESQYQFDRSMRRWERLKERYSDYTLFIPEIYKHFERSAF